MKNDFCNRSHESRDFHRENIMMEEIDNTGHYPWIENPEQVKAIFEKYFKFISTRNPSQQLIDALKY